MVGDGGWEGVMCVMWNDMLRAEAQAVHSGNKTCAPRTDLEDSVGSGVE